MKLAEDAQSLLPPGNTSPGLSVNKSYYAAAGKGLGVFSTILFVIGEMAGGGVLSLPYGVYQMGWIGSVMVVVIALVSGYTGVLLGRCWQFLLLQWPEDYASEHVRDPYPSIGERAAGRWARITVSWLINVTLFAVSTVFLLLLALNLQCLFAHSLQYRYWVLIIGAVLIPMNLLESPKDAWWVAAIATGATSIAVVTVIILLLLNGENPTATAASPTFESFVLGVATVAFAFGGHASFPTYQHDMADTSKFGVAVIIGYVVILAMYIPVSTIGSQYLKGDTSGNILANLHAKSPGVNHAVTAVTWLFNIHILFGYVLVSNPVSQDIERLLNLPQKFGLPRVILRTVQVILSIAVAVGVPCFTKILSLIGGTTVMLLSYIFPALFFLQLAAQLKYHVPLHELVINYLIIGVSFLMMGATIYSALQGFIKEGCKYPKGCH
eukprot:scpid75636/ scgid24866/ 